MCTFILTWYFLNLRRSYAQCLKKVTLCRSFLIGSTLLLTSSLASFADVALQIAEISGSSHTATLGPHLISNPSLAHRRECSKEIVPFGQVQPSNSGVRFIHTESQFSISTIIPCWNDHIEVFRAIFGQFLALADSTMLVIYIFQGY